jgi:hypothetical protein
VAGVPTDNSINEQKVYTLHVDNDRRKASKCAGYVLENTRYFWVEMRREIDI